MAKLICVDFKNKIREVSFEYQSIQIDELGVMLRDCARKIYKITRDEKYFSDVTRDFIRIVDYLNDRY